MGGKSRKSGQVSKKLIDRLKSGNFKKNKKSKIKKEGGFGILKSDEKT